MLLLVFKVDCIVCNIDKELPPETSVPRPILTFLLSKARKSISPDFKWRLELGSEDETGAGGRISGERNIVENLAGGCANIEIAVPSIDASNVPVLQCNVADQLAQDERGRRGEQAISSDEIRCASSARL